MNLRKNGNGIMEVTGGKREFSPGWEQNTQDLITLYILWVNIKMGNVIDAKEKV